MSNLTRICLRLPAEGKQKLEELSDEYHRTLSDQLRHSLLLGLLKEESDIDESNFFPDSN